MTWIYGFWIIIIGCTQESAPKEEPEASLVHAPTESQVSTTTDDSKERQVFELQDGTTITGVLLGTNEKGFKIHSKSMGTIHIPMKELKKMNPYMQPESTTQSTISKAMAEYAATRNLSSTPPQDGNQREIPSPNPMNPGLIKSIQDTMMQDTEIMGLLYTMQQDPQLMQALQDPQLLNLIRKGDLKGMQKHSAFKKLESNKQIREVLDRMR